MSDASTDYEPVRVRVENASELTPAGLIYTASYETYVLTSNDPVQCILPQDPTRRIAFVQALDNDIVIGSKAQVTQALNTETSVPQPIGGYIPKSNGSPTPIVDCNAVYAGVTTTSSNSRVSVIATSRG